MRYPPLLLALFLALLLKPFAEHFPSFPLPSGVLLLLVYLSVIYAFRHSHALAVCLTLLALGSVTLRLEADPWWPHVGVVGQGLNFVAMVLVAIAIFFEVLRARSASSDLVTGAVCLYLVLGLAWTFLYYSMYLLWPGSIFASVGSVASTTSDSKFTELLYFSMSALTTIGSSGGEAVTTLARQLAVVESAVGQLYLAVLISRLVGFSTTNDTKL